MRLVGGSETRGLFGEALSDDADKLLECGSASAKLQRGICFFFNKRSHLLLRINE